ncbi:transposase [Candidatus Enterovibrio escicola]|uniref:transposase n=1 Tax=Candidatus Enterovibrio escicola TaxID=1927127 RepID=UPI001237E6F8
MRSSGYLAITIVDLTKLQLCYNLHISRHRVFDGVVKLGKGTMGWFYVFKLHLRINDQGGIMLVKGTRPHVNNRRLVHDMANILWEITLWK